MMDGQGQNPTNLHSQSDSTSTDKGAIHLTAADFQPTLDNSAVPVMVDFYAVWCGPCKLAGPIIDRLSETYRGRALVAKLDVDEYADIAAQYEVRSIPTVIVFNKVDGKMIPVERKVGFPGEDGYKQMLDKVATATKAS